MMSWVGREGIYLMSASDSTIVRRISATPWRHYTAATDWSPDGSKLVLQSMLDTILGSKTDVFVVNVDGANFVDLTNNPP